MARTRDFGAVIERTLAKEPELRAAVEHERLNARIATLILAARESAGLTQQQLADLIGTRQSVIARLEDAAYQGHSLTMLAKIAHALDRQVLVELEPIAGKRATSLPKSKHTPRSTKRNR